MPHYSTSSFAESISPVGTRRLVFEQDSETIVANLDYNAGWRVEPHSHEWLSIMIFTAGTGRGYDVDKWIEVAPGSLIITPPGFDHGLEASTDISLTEIYVGTSQKYFDLVNSGYWRGTRV